MAPYARVAAALAVVAGSMMVLFAAPSQDFAAATFFSTGCMIAAAYLLGALKPTGKLSGRSVATGVASALALYLLFYLGAQAIAAFHPLGITPGSETSIYSLIASPANPVSLQVAVLFFDSAGYESFFRGVLQKRLSARLGLGAAPIIALLDAGLHLATLNLLWVVATFVTDLVWGLTYHYGRGTQASFTSHFLWDLAIFIIRPVM